MRVVKDTNKVWGDYVNDKKMFANVTNVNRKLFQNDDNRGIAVLVKAYIYVYASPIVTYDSQY